MKNTVIATLVIFSCLGLDLSAAELEDQTTDGQVSYIENRTVIELVQGRLFNINEMVVPAPNGKWDLLFPRQNWILQGTKRRADGDGYYFMFSNPQSKLNLS